MRINCNREAKLLKLKANYNYNGHESTDQFYCNREAKLLKLKANYNDVDVQMWRD